MARSLCSTLRLPLLALVFLILPTLAAAQELVPELRGRLYLDTIPADSGTVILHRVNPEDAGPVDSVRVGSGGNFVFPVQTPPAPGSGEVLFVSSRREGILYFGEPISEPAGLDSLYVVRAFETREAPEGGLPFTVALRGLFVDQGPMGWRVTDLLQIRNDSSVTWVSGEEGDHPVWQYPVPPEARGLRVGRSDLDPEAARFEDGVLQVRSPIPPGERLYVIQYELDVLNFSIPMPGVTELMEIFVSDEAPPLQMPPLIFDQPVELEPGSLYRRWVGEGLVQVVARVEPRRDGDGAPLAWIVVGLAVVLLGVGVWAVSRRQGGGGGRGGAGGGLAGAGSGAGTAEGPTGGSGTGGGSTGGSGTGAEERRRELLLLVARLDDAAEERGELSPEEEARYRSQRDALMEELRALGTPDAPSAASPGTSDAPSPASPGPSDAPSPASRGPSGAP